MSAAPERQPCECGQDIDDLPATVSHCFSHHVNEPVDRDTYRVCFGCKHVYPTAEALVDAYQEAVVDLGDLCDGLGLINRWRERRRVRRITADEIYFCQECVHDF